MEKVPCVVFEERDKDNYVLTADEEVALEAAWNVLQAIEQQNNTSQFYDDTSKDSTLDYLRDGGKEHPLGGIFAVELFESLGDNDKVDLLVSNRNGRGNDRYRGILRNAVQIVGISSNPSIPK